MFFYATWVLLTLQVELEYFMYITGDNIKQNDPYSYKQNTFVLTFQQFVELTLLMFRDMV